jgi:uncharacterized membrane protein YkvA (DUF1232 family)
MGKTLKRTAAFRALWLAVTAGSRGGPSLGRRMAALPRMIRASMRGEYDGRARLALMSMATVYVVSPIDLVPEAFLLVLGLADDALMVTWLAGALLAETERFLAWEAGRRDAGRWGPTQTAPGRPVQH